jgi:hypothetical protein
MSAALAYFLTALASGTAGYAPAVLKPWHEQHLGRKKVRRAQQQEVARLTQVSMHLFDNSRCLPPPHDRPEPWLNRP